MKPKTTLILFLVIAALAVFIKYFESKRPNTEEARVRPEMWSISIAKSSMAS